MHIRTQGPHFRPPCHPCPPILQFGCVNSSTEQVPALVLTPADVTPAPTQLLCRDELKFYITLSVKRWRVVESLMKDAQHGKAMMSSNGKPPPLDAGRRRRQPCAGASNFHLNLDPETVRRRLGVKGVGSAVELNKSTRSPRESVCDMAMGQQRQRVRTGQGRSPPADVVI